VKNLIIYFSSTGNSFFAAKYLTEHLENCIAVSITKIEPSMEISTYTSIGFIFPTYFFSIPKFFSQSIKKLNLNKDTYFYGITTCNGFSGNTGYQLKMLLENKGCNLSFFRILSMPGNNIIEYAPPTNEIINKKIIDSKKKLSGIVPMINNRDIEEIKKKYHFISTIFFNVMYSSQDKWNKKFYVNSKCSSCGLCENICQFNNIVNDNGQPRWRGRCEHCVACIQLCPNQAIEYGKRTTKRNRYMNPQILAKDLM